MSLRDPNAVNPSHPKRIAIVIANPAVSTTTGWPVGFWWSELTHPCYAFTETGYEVEIFSPDGGACQADAMSDPRDPSGAPLAAGRTVTGFANVEEDFADRTVWQMGALPEGTHIMPWRIEDELKRSGANYVQGGLWRGFAVRDGNLVTGQQNFSGTETAALVIEALGR